MSTRLRERVRDFPGRYPRLAAAKRTAVPVLGILALLVALAALVGFALGAPGPTDGPPAVDFDDDPAVVVAAASERLAHRNYTVESWVRSVDYRTGGVSGGQFYRLHVEAPRGQVRGRLRPAASYADYEFLGDTHAREVFATDGAAWVKLAGQDYWQRSRPAGAFADDALAIANTSRRRLAAANLTVRRDNETVFVAETTDPPAVGFDRAGTVRYVVAKGPEPHLQQIRFDADEPTGRTTRLRRIVHYGETVAIRPAELPSTTVSEVGARVIRGWDRLL